VDPLAEKTIEPYLYAGNNPIRYTDPTGMSKDDFRVKKNGNHHTIETTVHTYGDLSSEQAAAQIQKKYADLNKNTSVGNNRETMSFNITVRHHDSKESAIKSVTDTPGDNLLELSKNIDIDNINLYDVSRIKSTEHNLDIGEQGGFAITGGREGKALYPNDGVHEIGHFFGLGDRYETTNGYPFSPAPFTNDIMSSNFPRDINSVHYQNIYNHISNENNEYTTQGNTRIYRDIGRIKEVDRK